MCGIEGLEVHRPLPFPLPSVIVMPRSKRLVATSTQWDVASDIQVGHDVGPRAVHACPSRAHVLRRPRLEVVRGRVHGCLDLMQGLQLRCEGGNMRDERRGQRCEISKRQANIFSDIRILTGGTAAFLTRGQLFDFIKGRQFRCTSGKRDEGGTGSEIIDST